MHNPSKLESVLYYQKTLSVMPTDKCTAACSNCGSLSSPSANASLPIEVMLSAIKEASTLGFGNVVFTGGEPTLRWADLLEAVRFTHEVGLVSRVVTNAFWAKTVALADRRISQLLAAGLSEINFSTGDEHVKFVPLDRVVNAVIASVKNMLEPHIMIEIREGNRVTEELFWEHPGIANLSSLERRRVSIRASPWMPLDPDEESSYPEDYAANKDNVSSRLGCDSVLQTYVIGADRRIGSCCGLGMKLVPELNVGRYEGEGSLKASILDAEDDFLKLWLRYDGPEKILAWVASRKPAIKWEDKYAHRCQACLRLYMDDEVREVIRRFAKDKLGDVLTSMCLEEIDLPRLAPGQMPHDEQRVNS